MLRFLKLWTNRSGDGASLVDGEEARQKKSNHERILYIRVLELIVHTYFLDYKL